MMPSLPTLWIHPREVLGTGVLPGDHGEAGVASLLFGHPDGTDLRVCERDVVPPSSRRPARLPEDRPFADARLVHRHVSERAWPAMSPTA